MKRALQRHAQHAARVVPVILRKCDWHSSDFGTLQAVPRDGTPIASCPDVDEAMTEVALALRKVAQEMRAGLRRRPSSAPTLQASRRPNPARRRPCKGLPMQVVRHPMQRDQRQCHCSRQWRLLLDLHASSRSEPSSSGFWKSARLSWNGRPVSAERVSLSRLSPLPNRACDRGLDGIQPAVEAAARRSNQSGGALDAAMLRRCSMTCRNGRAHGPARKVWPLRPRSARNLPQVHTSARWRRNSRHSASCIRRIPMCWFSKA